MTTPTTPSPHNDDDAPRRVRVTDAAKEVVDAVVKDHGPVMFHQSGGCCDGSAPMCYPLGEFKVGARDVLLGEIAGAPFYMGAAQFELWKHTELTVDVVSGRGAGFSLEAPRGVRFVIRSRVLGSDEIATLDGTCPLPNAKR